MNDDHDYDGFWNRTAGVMVGLVWTLVLLAGACVWFQGVKYAARMVSQ